MSQRQFSLSCHLRHQAIFLNITANVTRVFSPFPNLIFITHCILVPYQNSENLKQETTRMWILQSLEASESKIVKWNSKTPDQRASRIMMHWINESQFALQELSKRNKPDCVHTLTSAKLKRIPQRIIFIWKHSHHQPIKIVLEREFCVSLDASLTKLEPLN